MKLTYRGIQYEPENSFLLTTEGEVGGTYRGQPWRYRYPNHVPKLQPKLWLQYRGVNYNKSSVVQSCDLRESSLPVVTSKTNFPIPTHFTPQNIEAKTEQAHLENIRRNLERRLSVAREKGNDELIFMLEKEYRELANK